MKILTGILAALAAALLVLLLQEHGATGALRAERAKLRAQLADTSEKSQTAAKIACGTRAAVAFRALGYSEKGGGDSAGNLGDAYNNHYDPALKVITHPFWGS